MLLALYLITPIIKPFAVKATDKDLLIALGLLFVLSSLFPTLNNMGAGLTGFMIISTPYIFIYLLGYWLCWRNPQKFLSNTICLMIGILVCLGIIVVKCYYGFGFYGYADPIVICLAALFFLLFRSLNVKWHIHNDENSLFEKECVVDCKFGKFCRRNNVPRNILTKWYKDTCRRIVKVSVDGCPPESSCSEKLCPILN